MPALTTYRPWTSAASAALRPLAVAAGILAAGAAIPAFAHADPPTDPLTNALNGAGIANSGSLSDRLASMGQSICPALVKPGASLAAITSQLSGKSGLPPNMVQMVAGMAIQMECPGVMTSLAHGNMPFPMQALGGGMPGIPGGGLGMPGASPSLVSNLFPLMPPAAPGAGGAATGLAIPGH